MAVQSNVNNQRKAVRTGSTMAAFELEIRPTSREALFGNVRAQLTGRELDVLVILMNSPDRVVTREAIYDQVWGGRMPHRDRAVDVYIRRVREKLRRISPAVTYIHTHFGIGYRFLPEPIEDSARER